MCVAAAALAGAAGATAQTREPDFAEFEPDTDRWTGFELEPEAAISPLTVISPLTEISPLADVAPAGQLRGGARPEQTLLFGGFDVWRNGFSVNGGFEWMSSAPTDDGFIVRLSLTNGTENYRTPARTYATDIFRGALLPGWRFKRGSFELKLFAGPDLEDRKFAPDVIGRKWRGAHLGARIAAEGWAEPVPELMLASSFYATTNAAGYGFRAAAGWRLNDAFWIGPEFSGARDQFSRQTRIGLHLTGLDFAAFAWSAAAGYVGDSFGRSGLYTRIGASVRH